MNPNSNPAAHTTLHGVLIDDGEGALGIEEFARACHVGSDWVVERVQAGLLLEGGSSSSDNAAATRREWRFTSASLVRARRLVHFERDFDANPELAALAADLVEEVNRLRGRLRALGLGD